MTKESSEQAWTGVQDGNVVECLAEAGRGENVVAFEELHLTPATQR